MTEPGRPISPELLIALNEEIAALVKAGVPLELGLRSIGRNVPTILGRVSQNIAVRLQQGNSLSEALDGAVPNLPKLYKCAVEAGLKSGQLPRVLELLVQYLQQSLDLRQRIEIAFVYPCIVSCIAYMLMLFCASESIHNWDSIWGDIRLNQSVLLSAYHTYCRFLIRWYWVPPALLALVLLSWFALARKSLLPDRKPSLTLGLIPGLTGAVKAWHWSIFCETAALLVEHQVPFPQAIRLAGGTAGNPTIDAEMTALARQVENGQTTSDSLENRTAVPPFLRWALTNSRRPAILIAALREGGALYYQKAIRRCEAIKTWLPLFLVLLIGGGSVFLYVISSVIPVLGLIHEIGREGEGIL